MTAFRKKTGKKATSDRDRYRNSGSEEVILLQRSKHFKDNVTNPSSKEGKTPVLKKEASQALCKYGRQTDRQTDAGSSYCGDMYSITDQRIRLSEVAGPSCLRGPLLIEEESTFYKGKATVTRSRLWCPGLWFPHQALSSISEAIHH